MPDELRQQIIDAAEKNRRSLNSEIIARLEESFSFSMPGWGSKSPGETPNERVEAALEEKYPDEFEPSLHWEFEKRRGALTNEFRARSIAAGKSDPDSPMSDANHAQQFVSKADFDALRSEIGSLLSELKKAGLIKRTKTT